jgi:hypothetical protein
LASREAGRQKEAARPVRPVRMARERRRASASRAPQASRRRRAARGAALFGEVAGCFAGALLPSPSPIVAIRSPTLTVSPFFFSTCASVPATGAGSSSVALSDSISTRASSRSTESPSFFSQVPI